MAFISIYRKAHDRSPFSMGQMQYLVPTSLHTDADFRIKLRRSYSYRINFELHERHVEKTKLFIVDKLMALTQAWDKLE